MRTFVYVDGFNLYFGSLKGTPFKWLDLFALARVFVPNDTVEKVRFYTAKVYGRGDPQRPIRQQTYWRALRATGVEVVEGHFLEHVVPMRNANPPPPKVQVWKSEEKGSDVNLAAHLVRDAFTGAFEQALVVSNDSDLALPVQLVRDEAKRPVMVVRPVSNQGRAPSGQLKRAAASVRDIRRAILPTCQLPDPFSLPSGGPLRKPSGWYPRRPSFGLAVGRSARVRSRRWSVQLVRLHFVHCRPSARFCAARFTLAPDPTGAYSICGDA